MDVDKNKALGLLIALVSWLGVLYLINAGDLYKVLVIALSSFLLDGTILLVVGLLRGDIKIFK